MLFPPFIERKRHRRHQARGAPEKKGRTFVNDTIRNDFHKRFLAKYIQ